MPVIPLISPGKARYVDTDDEIIELIAHDLLPVSAVEAGFVALSASRASAAPSSRC